VTVPPFPIPPPS
jgi:hypothetical protein